ncbi:MAG: DUF1361 domain-containing protein [Bacteroidota bacterium]
MERIKLFLFNRFHTIFPLVTITAISLMLLMIRLKLTQSFFLLFLVWNLFLAAIPYFLSTYLSSYHKINKSWLLLCTAIWLAFLPNAPYIVTDFIHLTHLQSHLKLLDFILISAFALSGLLCYVLSLNEMKQLLLQGFPSKWVRVFIFLVPFLCGFGIYLGRFLRWNSWDILRHPEILFTDIWEILIMPWSHKGAWLVTISFGIGLSLFQKGFNRIKIISRV